MDFLLEKTKESSDTFVGKTLLLQRSERKFGEKTDVNVRRLLFLYLTSEKRGGLSIRSKRLYMNSIEQYSVQWCSKLHYISSRP